MKTFVAAIVFVLVLAIETSAQPPHEHMAIFKQCKEEQGGAKLDPRQMMRAYRTGEVSQETGCFVACVFKGFGVVTQGSGGMQFDASKWASTLPPHVAENEAIQTAAQACSNVDGSLDECTYAAEILKCFAEQAKSVFEAMGPKGH